MKTHFALIDELNDAVAHGSAERRAAFLQRVTDLFAIGVDGYTGEQIIVFDDVFKRLVASADESARAKLAARLAAIPNTPPRIGRELACDDLIEVAGRMLQHFDGLDGATLVELAQSKGQDHLLAISRRTSLEIAVTDVLVVRGARAVVLSVAANPGAAFSEAGFTALIEYSHGDDELAVSVGLRRDIPRQHLLKLLVVAPPAARARLDSAHLMATAVIQSAVAKAASPGEPGTGSRNYVTARAHAGALHNSGSLDEWEVANFAAMGKFEETTAAIAVLSRLPIEAVERAMLQERPEMTMIIAKALGFGWPTLKVILILGRGDRGISSDELDQYVATFTRLKPDVARQIIEFERKRGG
jgi:uncharacterized protein (DUF2336 family)